ncbi:nucleoside ABC transporter membrane protein [Nocardioides terrae]|uniref:Nucleoside ABC transporter membrane protein n=1 Tax=Nocardioides terrae TaxID=574651 RepID=A0A1I1LM43_9ACTN|nr:ABC transporter permease [Nocardioides terrae]SFC74045.1 nucleoside ABC transporter membrane protein [Nocardioides terrae]
MSSTVEGALEKAATTVRKVRPTWPVVLLALAGVILLLALLRVITGADDVASSGTVRAAIRAALPIGLAGLGGLWAERSGVVNIGLEGMMIMGTFGAGWAGYQWGMWAGVAFALLFGALAGGVHAIATVGFGVDHIVSGVAINVIALGAAQYLAGLAFTGHPGGGPTQSPQVTPMSTFDVPGVADAAHSIAEKNWFFVSDLAGIVNGLTSRLTVLTLIGVLLFVLTWWVLWRTTFGLRVRSVGESPAAAESLGVSVYRYKYIAVIISGALAGLAGAYLVQDSTVYREGQTGGRGYIGLAAMIFGNWRPGGLAAGSGLFGYTDALRLRSGGESVHALLLLLAVLLVVFGLALFRKNRRQALVSAGAAVLLVVLFLVTDEIAGDFTGMTPYLTTLLVLALFSQRLRMPKADGQVYRKGSAG